MGNVLEELINTKKSQSYIEYVKYHQNNIFGITKVSRWELMHSNFIAWLLNDNLCVTFNHFQMYKFILMLGPVKNAIRNNEARVDLNIIKKFLSEDNISSISIEREFHNIDILIEVTTNEKILPIIIENKVDSKENGKNRDQTIEYYKYCEEKFSDFEKYYRPIYIFLTPLYNKTEPKQKDYLWVTYQDLVDYVIEPTLLACIDEKSRDSIKKYLQCLSFQEDNEKGDKTMAISSEERAIIKRFIDENKNLISVVIESLDDVDEDTKDKLKASVRDSTNYEFNGKKELGKGRLVLEVVKKYFEDNDPVFHDLEKAFPKKLIGGKGVVALETDVDDKEKGVGDGSKKRYFVDDPIILSNGDKVIVNSQWTKTKIDKFIEHVAEKLHYEIKEQS